MAAQYAAAGDPLGWFEVLYREAASGESIVPWADLQPNPTLVRFWRESPLESQGRTALCVGCGYGDDAEFLAAVGYAVTAFDIAPAAVEYCRTRFPESNVRYCAGDLLTFPTDEPFDFVFEAYTLQVLPPALRALAIPQLARLVRPGGHLLIIARAREAAEPAGAMPWPLVREELAGVELAMLRFDDFVDTEDPPVRRFLALYSATSGSSGHLCRG